ncbi:MAG: NUDIX domain-containing protein, partial [Candidatus Nanohaloarchaea archaeon]
VVLDEGRVLAIDTGDYLMLPGGGVESGESFEEAAERETLEETGVSIDIEEELVEQQNSVGGVEKVFLAAPQGEDKSSHWEGKKQWISLEEAKNRLWRHDRDMERLLERATDK